MKLTTDWSFSEVCFTNCRFKAFSLAPLVQNALSIRYTPQYKPPHKATIFHPTVWLEKHELEWTLRVCIHTNIMLQITFLRDAICLNSAQTITHLRKLSWLGGALWGCQIQVVLHELPPIIQASESWCFKSISFGKAKSSPVNRQDTGTWKSFVWEKSRVFLFPTFISLGRFLQSFQFSIAA